MPYEAGRVGGRSESRKITALLTKFLRFNPIMTYPRGTYHHPLRSNHKIARSLLDEWLLSLFADAVADRKCTARTNEYYVYIRVCYHDLEVSIEPFTSFQLYLSENWKMKLQCSKISYYL